MKGRYSWNGKFMMLSPMTGTLHSTNPDAFGHTSTLILVPAGAFIVIRAYSPITYSLLLISTLNTGCTGVALTVKFLVSLVSLLPAQSEQLTLQVCTPSIKSVNGVVIGSRFFSIRVFWLVSFFFTLQLV